jgi:hypothetical protein
MPTACVHGCVHGIEGQAKVKATRRGFSVTCAALRAQRRGAAVLRDTCRLGAKSVELLERGQSREGAISGCRGQAKGHR